jgi:hypothetical protein
VGVRPQVTYVFIVVSVLHKLVHYHIIAATVLLQQQVLYLAKTILRALPILLVCLDLRPYRH